MYLLGSVLYNFSHLLCSHLQMFLFFFEDVVFLTFFLMANYPFYFGFCCHLVFPSKVKPTRLKTHIL